MDRRDLLARLAAGGLASALPNLKALAPETEIHKVEVGATYAIVIKDLMGFDRLMEMQQFLDQLHAGHGWPRFILINLGEIEIFKL